jgi:predicted nucleic acid-binding protein
LTETLQGFRSDTDYAKAKKHLLVFPVYSLKGTDSYIAASQIYRLCRKSGLTIRKTVDCLIARIALENDLILIHKDKDFEMIAKVTPLKIFQT